MPYDKKLLEEQRKYGLVTCPICKKRKTKNWNIYSANSLCSPECSRIMIDKLLSNINTKQNDKKTNTKNP